MLHMYGVVETNIILTIGNIFVVSYIGPALLSLKLKLQLTGYFLMFIRQLPESVLPTT